MSFQDIAAGIGLGIAVLLVLGVILHLVDLYTRKPWNDVPAGSRIAVNGMTDLSLDDLDQCGTTEVNGKKLHWTVAENRTGDYCETWFYDPSVTYSFWERSFFDLWGKRVVKQLCRRAYKVDGDRSTELDPDRTKRELEEKMGTKTGKRRFIR